LKGHSMSITNFLKLSPVMPVVTIHDAADAVPVAKALVRGGIRIIEITLRTPSALGAMRAVADAVPEMVVGAGTVLNRGDLDACISAGAAFAISPGATAELLAAGRHSPIPYLPAVATSSDIMAGLASGYTHFKLFPATVVGGTAALKALAGPFPNVKFCPTGGISEATAAEFLALQNVLCVGGSWVASDARIKAKDWDGIEAAARAAVALKK
jgi:2-dehydro-3-deoxyphosphogluconate aldolase/(4S)-4-hydroxy-2-oxoglutarate aldolase